MRLRIVYLIVILLLVSCINDSKTEVKCGTKIFDAKDKLIYNVNCKDSGTLIIIDSFFNEYDYFQRIINKKYGYEFSYLNILNKELEFNCYYKGSSVFKAYRSSYSIEKIEGNNIIELSDSKYQNDTLFSTVFFVIPVFTSNASFCLVERDSLFNEKILIDTTNIGDKFFYLLKTKKLIGRTYWIKSMLTLNSGNQYNFNREIK